MGAPLITLADVRARAIAAQGYSARRRRAETSEVLAALRALSCVQLDSISTVERSHRLVLSSRAGAYDERVVSDLLRKGKAFESWAHEACLIPIEDYPLYKRRMRERREHHWWGDVIGGDPALARAVLRRIEREGPLKASDFEGRSLGMWQLKPEKRMLEALWTAGKLAIRGRDGFQRVYDLPERVIPARVLAAPMPTARETLRALCLRAVRARGALTAAGVAEHFRIEGRAKTVRPHLEALAREGEIGRAEDERGRVWYLGEGEGRDRARAGDGAPAVLLSPFDNLLWDRAMLRHVWGFDHVMEIYKRPHERRYGYYVLPFLMGDRLAGRVDLKAEREASTLVARRVHREPGWTSREEDGLAKALARLAWTLGLSAADVREPEHARR